MQGASRVTVRSAYLEQVRRLAPPELLGRETELADLAAFCLDEHRGPYIWWRAPAWTGKSALMSTFVLRPPAILTGRIRIISFFITARLAAQDTREAFTTVLLEQLCQLTGQELPIAAGEVTREAFLLDLLSQAAAACRSAGNRLILVVDGLDEDRGTTVGPDAHSIAALLPGHPPAGMRIIVAGRPNPPIPDDVPDWHPLRDPGILRILGQSPYARDIERLGKSEVRRLHSGTPVERDLLGLITAARGGLSAADLRELTGGDLAEIEDVLHSVAGRTFTRRAGEWKTDEAYLLGHEEIHNAACRYMGPKKLAEFQDRLHTWADEYREWPAETPEYLLRGYPRLLEMKGDLNRLAALASEPARHELMLELTGGDTAAITEVTTVQNLLLTADEVDLEALAVLSVRRNELQDRNKSIPPALPAVWATISRPVRAGHLARSIDYPDFRAEALAGVGQAIVRRGESPDAAFEFAEEAALAAELAWPDGVPAMAVRIAEIGLFARAERLIREIADPAVRADGLAVIAATAPDRDKALTLCREAVALARDSADPDSGYSTLIKVAGKLLAHGDHRGAEALTCEATSMARNLDNYSRCLALAEIAMARTAMGDHDDGRPLIADAELAVAEITDIRLRHFGFQRIIAAAVEIGDVAWAVRIVESEDAQQLKDHLQDCLVRAAAAAADFGSAERAASAISAAADRRQALVHAAGVAAREGDLAWAEQFAEAAEHAARTEQGQKARARALTEVAAVVAAAGDDLRAKELALEVEQLARMSDDPAERIYERACLAQALAETGDPETARCMFTEMADVLQRITDGETVAWKAKHLAVTGVSLMGTPWARDLLMFAAVLVRSMTDPYYAMIYLAHLSQAWASLGMLERAQELLDESLSKAPHVRPSNLPRAMTSVVLAALAVGPPERAADLARSVKEPGDRTWCLAVVAQSAAQAGDTPGARELLAEAELHLQTITDHGTRAGSLANIVHALVLLGDVDRAEELASTILRPGWSCSAFTVVARARAKRGDYDRAERLARRIVEPDKLAKALLGIAEFSDEQRAVRLTAEALALGAWTSALSQLITRRPEVVATLARAALSKEGSWRHVHD
ncbi:hypothetical protein Van01_63320 [Micromonospora andamanensis]|uniref:Nephrocystin 3-like N-terminal domain-containing protein n=1 Tax=Micromonospora andamanensis TaxID=1287068 RepID=A0ABQ4I5G0_9ACTN|nr:hypothetical protein Van01_63320 [Micromonospora andamanensis]